MMKYQRDHGIPAEQYAKLSDEEKTDKFIVGKLSQNEYPGYTQLYQQLIERSQEKSQKKVYL